MREDWIRQHTAGGGDEEENVVHVEGDLADFHAEGLAGGPV